MDQCATRGDEPGGRETPSDVSRAVLAEGTVELPVLPRVAQRVMVLANDPDGSVTELAHVLKHDPAFAAHLLRLANSPLFAAKSPIVSITQALARLGMRQVRDFALVISMRAGVYSVAGFEDDLEELFRTALVSALFAQEVARSRRRGVEEAFLAGLLHDIGEPVALRLAVEQVGKTEDPRSASARERIWASVRELHGPIGADVVRAWTLPEPLALAALKHHQQFPLEPLTQMVAVADALTRCALLRCGCESGEAHAPHASEATMEALNLYPEDMAALASRGPELVAAAGAA